MARRLLSAIASQTGRGSHLHVGCGFRTSVSTPVRQLLGTLRPKACLPPRHRANGRRACLILHKDLLTFFCSSTNGMASGMYLGPSRNGCNLRVPSGA